MTSKRTGRVLLAVALVLTASLASVSTASTARASGSTCADVLLVGARGSGEPGPGSTSGWTPTLTDPLGLGDEVLSASKTVAAGLHGRRTVETVSVRYAADAVVSKDFLLHIDRYFIGLSLGVDFVDQLLRSKSVSCPNQQIMLAGYSQGAMVMHRLLDRFAASTTGTAILQRLDAAVLIGDGDRVKLDTTKNSGAFSADTQGIGLYYRSQSGSGISRFAPTLGARVLTVCNSFDPICDSTSAIADFLLVQRHFSYPGGQTLASGASTAAINVLNVPLPTPRTVPLTATKGTFLAHQLLADVSLGANIQWGVLSPAVLPPGLSLSSGGYLRGTPTVVPVGTTPIQVRGVVSGRIGPWQAAFLHWNPSSGGTVRAWGANRVGELGNGTTTNSSTPVQVSGLNGVTAVAGGSESGYALRADGTVWAWGSNISGGLGNGTFNDSSIPVQVSGLTGVTVIASGGRSGYALRGDGTVWAWGFNLDGELGNGTFTDSSTPVLVSGLNGITAIAGGGGAGYAVRGDGTIRAWGYNVDGELGNGTTTSSSTPVQVSGLTGITAIAGGNASAYALRGDGTVWAWGDNLEGGLGNGTTTNSSTPVQVSGLTGITAIAGGNTSGYALRPDGTVRAWGGNGLGQLGNGTTTNSSTPVQVSGLNGITAITSTTNIGLALRGDGTVRAWGYNGDGQLGNGTTTSSTTPVQVSGLTGISAIAGGTYGGYAVGP